MMVKLSLRRSLPRLAVLAAAGLAIYAVPALGGHKHPQGDPPKQAGYGNGFYQGKRVLTRVHYRGIRLDDPPKPVDHAPVPPPKVKGLIVLFSGKQEEVAANWRKNMTMQDATWKVEDGGLTARGGDIVTKQDFTDFQLHVEFKVPYMPNAKGQGRGNSGVGLQSHYEVQVLDSYGFAQPGSGDCGAVYSQSAPLVNACRPPLEWQTYDITFRAPRFEDGKLKEKGRVSVLLNGIIVQNNTEINGPTGIGGDRPLDKPGPIYLQDHGNTVQYRNIWILPLPEKGSKDYDPH